jgi:hypothetical protein
VKLLPWSKLCAEVSFTKGGRVGIWCRARARGGQCHLTHRLNVWWQFDFFSFCCKWRQWMMERGVRMKTEARFTSEGACVERYNRNQINIKTASDSRVAVLASNICGEMEKDWCKLRTMLFTVRLTSDSDGSNEVVMGKATWLECGGWCGGNGDDGERCISPHQRNDRNGCTFYDGGMRSNENEQSTNEYEWTKNVGMKGP